MENFYAAYTKQVGAETFFFVKKYAVYPELKNVPPLLESYGMHTDFNKACNIAAVYDVKIKQQLLLEIETNTSHAKVIDFTNDFKVKRASS